MKTAKREFYVIIERDENGYYVEEVTQVKTCYTQSEIVDELMANIKEVIRLCLKDTILENIPEIVFTQKIVV